MVQSIHEICLRILLRNEKLTKLYCFSNFYLFIYFQSQSQEPNAYNATMDAVVEIVTVSTAEPAKKPVTEGDSDVRAGQVT